MARIAGVNIPTNKRVVIALQYIHGIGPRSAKEITEKVGIPAERRVNQLTDAEVLQIRETIDRDYQVEGDLRREVSMNIKRLMDLGCYRGLRHRRACRSAASARIPTRAPARARPSRSPARRSKRTRRRISRSRTRVAYWRTRIRSYPEPWNDGAEDQGTWPRQQRASAAASARTSSSGVAHVNAIVQQHHDHHHRRPGQHDRLVVGRAHGLQGLAQVDAVRRAGRRRGRRQEGRRARHAHARGRGLRVRAPAASRRFARCRRSASRSPRSAT